MSSLKKNLRSTLILSSAIIFSGLSFVFADPAAAPGKDSAAKQSLDSFAAVSGASVGAELPAPAAKEAALDELSPLLVKSNNYGGNNGGGTPACKPSAAIAPGTDFSPKIEDQVRTQAIIDLLAKISACKPLPYSHDGIVNTNTEGGMPQAAKGYYLEYTLMVPGRQTGDGPVPVVIGGKTYMTGDMQSARGPERIIIGGGKDIYYTMDHYKSFVHLAIVK